MRISKYELITEIAMLCDELEAYKRELRDIERGKGTCNNIGGEQVNPIDLLCIRAGRKKIFEDCTYSWRSVTATRDDDTGAIEVTTFERFRESVFNRCPDSMSRNEFFEYFDSEFRTMYDEEKEKAIASLKEQEADND